MNLQLDELSELINILTLPTSAVSKIVSDCIKEQIFDNKSLMVVNRASALFLAYIVDTTTEIVKGSKRKTIYLKDIYTSLKNTGFENLINLN